MTIFRKNPLLIWLLAFLGLGLFWFYVMLNPWLGFVTSDDAVPYIQTLTEWRPQDLFYWGTSRMGMLYEVMWKAGLSLFGIREAVVGSALNTELFYLVHSLFMWAGFCFWLQTLRTRTARWVFFLFFIPISRQGVEFFLLPGQPYGVLFFLTGLFFWYLLEKSKGKQNHIIFGLLIGALWIQHELSGLLVLGVYAFRYRHKYLKTILIGLLPLVVVGCICKHESQKWFEGNHYSISSFGTILDGLWFTLRDGSWWVSIRRLTGHVFTLAVLFYLFDLWKTRRSDPFWNDSRRVAFVGALVAILAIHLPEWYVTNNRAPRYFTNVIPVLIWAFLSKFEILDRHVWQRWVYLAACLIPMYKTQAYDVWINPVVRSQFTISLPPDYSFVTHSLGACDEALVRDFAKTLNPTIVEWSPTWLSEGCTALRFQKAKLLTFYIQSTGCESYIDDYWDSYILTALSNGQLLANTNMQIRNPELMALAKSARPLCLMPREGTPFQTLVSELNLDCKASPRGFLFCSDNATEAHP
ncbi:MAG: hypothetical protein JST80_08515 [Bdellovibrionales bacterium]|nr:hypothetical protein [Bdellovibrionales bacterium]